MVGVLLAFHFATEFLNVAARRNGIRWERFSLLGLQAIIFLLAILTRTSNVGLLAALGLIWLYNLVRGRRDAYGIRLQLAKGVAVALAASSFLALILALLPAGYLSDGRVTGVAWHRAFISLGLNPTWPFGNLPEIYDCDYPDTPGQRLKPGLLDANGGCIWIHYAHVHNIQAFPWNPHQWKQQSETLFSALSISIPRQVWDLSQNFDAAAEIEQAIYPKFDLSKYTSLLRSLLWTAFAAGVSPHSVDSARPHQKPAVRRDRCAIRSIRLSRLFYRT